MSRVLFIFYFVSYMICCCFYGITFSTRSSPPEPPSSPLPAPLQSCRRAPRPPRAGVRRESRACQTTAAACRARSSPRRDWKISAPSSKRRKRGARTKPCQASRSCAWVTSAIRTAHRRRNSRTCRNSAVMMTFDTTPERGALSGIRIRHSAKTRRSDRSFIVARHRPTGPRRCLPICKRRTTHCPRTNDVSWMVWKRFAR